MLYSMHRWEVESLLLEGKTKCVSNENCMHLVWNQWVVSHLLILYKCMARNQNAAVTVQKSFTLLSLRNSSVFSYLFSKEYVQLTKTSRIVHMRIDSVVSLKTTS